MKYLFVKIILSAIAFTSIAQADSYYGEISIRPLRTELTTTIGVKGIEVGVKINAGRAAQEAIYITGEVATSVIEKANTILKSTPGAVLYGFDASKQMIVITGLTAKNLIKDYGKKALTTGTKVLDLSVNSSKVLVYETELLTRYAASYAKLALSSAAQTLANHTRSIYADVKVIAYESTKTAKDAANTVAHSLSFALTQSLEIAIDISNTAEAYAIAGVLFVSDAGLFVYDHTKSGLYKIGEYGEMGYQLLEEGLLITSDIAVTIGSHIFDGIKSVYNALPSVRIDFGF
jgi:hypothetical protein